MFLQYKNVHGTNVVCFIAAINSYQLLLEFIKYIYIYI